MKLLNNYSINLLLQYIKFEDLNSLTKIIDVHKSSRKFIDREPSLLPKIIDNSYFINEAYNKYVEEMFKSVSIEMINYYFLELDVIINMLNLALLELATQEEAARIVGSKYVNSNCDVESQLLFSGFECFILGRIPAVSARYGKLLRQLSNSKSYRNNAIHKSVILNNLRLYYMCEFLSSCSDLLADNRQELLKLLKTNHPTHCAFSIEDGMSTVCNFKK